MTGTAPGGHRPIEALIAAGEMEEKSARHFLFESVGLQSKAVDVEDDLYELDLVVHVMEARPSGRPCGDYSIIYRRMPDQAGGRISYEKEARHSRRPIYSIDI